MSDDRTGSSIHPTPTDEEAAAIVAAVTAAWPRPTPEDAPVERDPAWRFSGRWWNRPTPHARQRPWRR
ncbi:MAG: hypothetical protein ACFCVK_17135 [Acidimicrobiales bacterium]